MKDHFNSNKHEVLPLDRQLEHLIKQDFSIVAEALADIYEQRMSFVDTDTKQTHPETMTIIGNVSLSAGYDEDMSDTAYRAIAEGVHFAYTTARVASPAGILSSYEPYHYQSSDETYYNNMHYDAEKYLQERPAIAALVEAFIGSIDVSLTHAELATVAAALSFMQIEEGERQQYIDQQVTDFSAQLDEL